MHKITILRGKRMMLIVPKNKRNYIITGQIFRFIRSRVQRSYCKVCVQYILCTLKNGLKNIYRVTIKCLFFRWINVKFLTYIFFLFWFGQHSTFYSTLFSEDAAKLKTPEMKTYNVVFVFHSKEAFGRSWRSIKLL